jgi:hypothetical protein
MGSRSSSEERYRPDNVDRIAEVHEDRLLPRRTGSHTFQKQVRCVALAYPVAPAASRHARPLVQSTPVHGMPAVETQTRQRFLSASFVGLQGRQSRQTRPKARKPAESASAATPKADEQKTKGIERAKRAADKASKKIDRDSDRLVAVRVPASSPPVPLPCYS